MPTSIMEEVDDLLDATAPAQSAGPLPEDAPRPARPARLSSDAHGTGSAVLQCPSCGSAHVAQVLGDNGGISFVCTACGHSWS
ncbi:hypothetical protein [Streptomyces paromomycinus]|uniref:Uncharacterized protein n=1 Tax=Streptomyces paromomycinus TaxID=92743 RepID=A0A401W950_STREY|nr:hypothetical protein [Streptomyces paromomycinus]GCD45844.1 hypothetical protein GKJPGBOP_05586 [Streptomyces paromomycinus]